MGIAGRQPEKPEVTAPPEQEEFDDQ
jgi:hypothetical protein